LMIALGGFAASQVWLGLAKGKILSRFPVWTERAKRPVYLWIFFGIWSFIAFVLLAGALFFGLLSAIRSNS
jgi:hypothetical protein